MVESNRPDLDVKFSMDEKAISLGQAYSQLGQVYANFEREDAEVYFFKVLDIFKEENAHCRL